MLSDSDFKELLESLRETYTKKALYERWESLSRDYEKGLITEYQYLEIGELIKVCMQRIENLKRNFESTRASE